MSNLKKGQEFIKILEKELKRLSPTLNLSMSNLDPYSQIVYIVRVAIDTLLEEKRSLESEYLKLSHESLPHSSSSDQGDMAQAKSKLIDAQKQLKKFERLMKQKEKQLEEREIQLGHNSISKTDNSMSREVSSLNAKNKELEIRIKALIDKEEELKQVNEKLNKERNHFEGEKLAVFHMKSQLQQNHAESERLKELASVGYENTKRERERVQLEEKILKEKEQALELKQDYIEKTLSELEKKKKAFEDEKSKFRLEKSNTVKQGIEERLSLIDERSDKKFNFIDSRSQTMKTLPETPDRNSNTEMEKLFSKLKEQIEIYNGEVVTREQKILEKQKKLRTQQEVFNSKLLQLGRLENFLNGVKDEIIQFRDFLMTEFEDMFKRMRVQFELFNRKLAELEKLQVRLSNNIFLKNPNY